MVWKKIRRERCHGSQHRRKEGVTQMSYNPERSTSACSLVVIGDCGSTRGTFVGSRNQIAVGWDVKLVLSMPQLKKKVPFKVCNRACVCWNKNVFLVLSSWHKPSLWPLPSSTPSWWSLPTTTTKMLPMNQMAWPWFGTWSLRKPHQNTSSTVR